jgi:hypothetical protein
MATPKIRSTQETTAHNPQIFCPCCSLPLVYRAGVELKRSASVPRAGAQLFDCPACGLFDSRGARVTRGRR